jgi:release factor glutamine methyltransferase
LTFTVTDTVARLRAAGCVFAEDEAAVLHAAAADEAALLELVRRRAEGEPLEQVVGYADFCGVRVRLRRGVFVPRVRSELLVRLAGEEAIKAIAEGVEATKAAQKPTTTAGEPIEDAKEATATGEALDATEETDPSRPEAGARITSGEGAVVVDLCCGSGALGLAVAHRVPGVDLHAADLDPTAVACARDNIRRNVYEGDLFEALPTALRGRIDVLMANVPYVASRHIPLLPAEARDHEPRTALDGGSDGLDVFRAVAAEAPAWLTAGGVLLSEITEAQIDLALVAAHGAGLRADIACDDDLEATVIRARRRR